MIKLSDLKSIYKSNELRSVVPSLREKLVKIVSNVEWDYYDAIEHNYCGPLQIECLYYYDTGRICKMMLACKKIEPCNICKAALTSRTWRVVTEEVNFTNLNNEEGCSEDEYLTQPLVGLYRFIQNLEKIYQRHCSSEEAYSVADKAIKDGIPNYPLLLRPFPENLTKPFSFFFFPVYIFRLWLLNGSLGAI